MQLHRHTDPDVFRAAVNPYLRANMDACSQLFTITQGLTADSMQQRQSWLAEVRRDGQTCAVALVNTQPPLRIVTFSEIDPDAVALVAAALRADGIVATDTIGSPVTVQAFAAACRQTGVERMHFGNQVLDCAPQVPVCAGSMRAARADDFDLLMRWEPAFLHECGLSDIPSNLEGEIMQRLAGSKRLDWLWEVDGKPVAMARGNACPPIARIGMVYTAPAQRGHGYAGALTGTLAAQLQMQDCGSVYLFTDLANPTSNGVYRRIGFRCVGELVHLILVGK